MENKDMPAEFYCKWWLDEREENNENEIIIKDENGDYLNLVAATIDINMSCYGCYYEKKSSCPKKLLAICTKNMIMNENSTIFIKSQRDE